MRRYGIAEPYEKLKAFTRGQRITEEAMRRFVAEESGLPDEGMALMRGMEPRTYVGNAEAQAKKLKDAL